MTAGIKPTPFSKRHPIVFLSTAHGPNQFSVAPKHFKVFGLVRQGMAFGLLAVRPDGVYVRVNGSYIEPLHSVHADWVSALIQESRDCGLPDERLHIMETHRSQSPKTQPQKDQTKVLIKVKRKRWNLTGINSVCNAATSMNTLFAGATGT